MGIGDILALVELANSPNAPYFVTAGTSAILIWQIIKQHRRIINIDEKLKKYETEFRRFELRMNRLLEKQKVSKEFAEALNTFLDESKLIFEGLR